MGLLPSYKIHMPTENFKGYRRQTLKVGDVLDLPVHKVTAFNMSLQLVDIVFADGVKTTVPFSFPSLNISQYGVEGYMPPEHLPFEHVGFIMSRKPNNMVVHRLSNETKQLILDRNFDLNGIYALAPIDKGGKDVKYFTSVKWDLKTVKAHLESLQGKDLTLKGSVYGLMDENSKTFNQSILISKVNKERFIVFLLFDNGIVYPFSIKTFTKS